MTENIFGGICFSKSVPLPLTSNERFASTRYAHARAFACACVPLEAVSSEVFATYNKIQNSAMADDAHLHKLCQAGALDRISEYVRYFPDRTSLNDRLANRKGVFGYTPLHEAVASGHSDVLDHLLERAGDKHVNCRANSGYTPMHLAASSGHVDCVKVLLKHSADIGVKDEYGKTPKQTAELSSKIAIVRVLRGQGMILLLYYRCAVFMYV